MIAQTKNNKDIFIRQISGEDFHALNIYLNELSDDTKKRFGPHYYDVDSLNKFYSTPGHIGIIAEEPEHRKIVAYSIIKMGYVVHDKPRLESLGLYASNEAVCTFAPSVADEWQSVGIGDLMLSYIHSILIQQDINHIILWGGVQADNQKAINYYLKNGFKILGEFEYHGRNYDMVFKFDLEE